MNDDGKDHSFSLNSTSGEIGPSGAATIWVTYAPSMPGTFSCTQY